jgi:nitroreductase
MGTDKTSSSTSDTRRSSRSSFEGWRDVDLNQALQTRFGRIWSARESRATAFARELKKENAMTRSELPMSVLDAIYKRRSVRSFLPQRIDEVTLRTLLAAAVHAPTAVHAEPWAFIILQDTTVLKRLSDRAKPFFLEQMQRVQLDPGGHRLDKYKTPDFNLFYNAGTLVIICATSTGPFVVADCWLAAENLILAACSMGLGTCVIGSAVAGLNDRDVKAEFGIPADLLVVAPIIVGVPSGETSATPRKDPQVLVWK